MLSREDSGDGLWVYGLVEHGASVTPGKFPNPALGTLGRSAGSTANTRMRCRRITTFTEGPMTLR